MMMETNGSSKISRLERVSSTVRTEGVSILDMQYLTLSDLPHFQPRGVCIRNLRSPLSARTGLGILDLKSLCPRHDLRTAPSREGKSPVSPSQLLPVAPDHIQVERGYSCSNVCVEL